MSSSRLDQVVTFDQFGHDHWKALGTTLGGVEMVKAILQQRATVKVTPVVAAVEVSVAHLRHLHSLTLASTSGAVMIAEAKDVFTSYIDPDFKNWGKKAGVETSAATVDVFEMTRDGQYKDLFGSLNVDPRQLTLTEGQIVEFCQTHREHLRQGGYGTFFLYEGKNKELFVAYVSVDGGQLEVGVDRFEYVNVWHAGCRIRLVVKQQTV